jgi:hypothetical protein
MVPRTSYALEVRDINTRMDDTRARNASEAHIPRTSHADVVHMMRASYARNSSSKWDVKCAGSVHHTRSGVRSSLLSVGYFWISNECLGSLFLIVLSWIFQLYVCLMGFCRASAGLCPIFCWTSNCLRALFKTVSLSRWPAWENASGVPSMMGHCQGEMTITSRLRMFHKRWVIAGHGDD